MIVFVPVPQLDSFLVVGLSTGGSGKGVSSSFALATASLSFVIVRDACETSSCVLLERRSGRVLLRLVSVCVFDAPCRDT